MPWLKDGTSVAPKTVYTAPPEAWPTVRVIYDPDADYPWSVVYGKLNGPDGSDLQADIEAIMGL